MVNWCSIKLLIINIYVNSPWSSYCFYTLCISKTNRLNTKNNNDKLLLCSKLLQVTSRNTTSNKENYLSTPVVFLCAIVVVRPCLALSARGMIAGAFSVHCQSVREPLKVIFDMMELVGEHDFHSAQTWLATCLSWLWDSKFFLC